MKSKRTTQVILLALLFISNLAFATRQITDTFIFNGNEYSLIGKTDGDFATPEQFGMTAIMMSTACYRGFYATYELTETNLLLRKISLREKNETYLPISGIHADTESKKYRGTYKNLNVAIKFTGKIRLAKDFIRNLKISMGFRKPTSFKTVFDVTLKDGRIVEIKDRSKEMEARRGEFIRRYEAGEPMQSIREAFSLDNIKLE